MGENQISKLVPNQAMKEGPGLPFHSRWEKLDKTRVMICSKSEVCKRGEVIVILLS